MTHSDSNLSSNVESIVIAHHHALVCEGIAKILQEAGFHIVGQADSGRSLLRLVAKHNPDIILVNWELSEVAPDTIRGLTEKLSHMTVVILTQPQSVEAFLPLLQAGARGCLSVNLSAQ